MPINDRLFHLLGSLEDEDLLHLWVHCLGNKPEQDGFVGGVRSWRIARLSQVWRASHGSALRNLARDPHELPWKQMLIDAADRLTTGLAGSSYRMDDPHSEESIEWAVLDLYDARVGPLWDRLTDKDRRKISTGASLPGANSVVGLLANGFNGLTSNRSLAAMLALLTAHERRRLIRINLEKVS
jgi:hypothetical protein